MDGIRAIREDKNSDVVVVTPLLPGHKISDETRKTIKRNDIPFTWILSEGQNNIPTNVQNGLNYYRKSMNGKARYVLPLDRDIVLGRNMIDRLYKTLQGVPKYIAFSYASFAFRGAVNVEFKAKQYDINSLVMGNYISSNSMIEIAKLDEIGGFVTNERYKRLLDWCLWLKFYQGGYIGIPSKDASFIAISTKDDVSAGTNADFKLKRERVYRDIILPIIKDRKNQIDEEKEKNKDEVETLTFDDML